MPIRRIIARSGARIKLDAPNAEEDMLDLTGTNAGTAGGRSRQMRADGSVHFGKCARRSRLTRHNAERADGRVGCDCNASVAAGECQDKKQRDRKSQVPTIAADCSNFSGRVQPQPTPPDRRQFWEVIILRQRVYSGYSALSVATDAPAREGAVTGDFVLWRRFRGWRVWRRKKRQLR